MTIILDGANLGLALPASVRDHLQPNALAGDTATHPTDLSWRINPEGAMLISTFLVEDKADIRATLVEAMEEVAPLKFIGHADGEAAARQWLGANDADWQLAIIDLFLTDGSGFGVLKDCQGRKPNQKVVVLTNYLHQNISSRCLQLGADKVFDKSTDLEQLVAFCRAHAASLEGLSARPGPSGVMH